MLVLFPLHQLWCLPDSLPQTFSTYLYLPLSLFLKISDVIPPECKGYVVISDKTRSKDFAGGNLACDQRNLPTVGKWHRFMGAAGTAMPTSCVPIHRCGTHAPGWLQGSHPTKEQGVVTRKVCFHWSGNCCKWSVNINVRDCGEFYVYKLPKSPVCSLRYCAEQKGAKTCCVWKTLQSFQLLIYCQSIFV